MIYVHFSHFDEFKAELEWNPGKIDGRVLRYAVKMTPSKMGFRYASLVATYKRDDYEIVKLEAPLGELWGKDFPQDEDTYKRRDELYAKLDALATSIGATSRAGVLSYSPQL